MRHIAAIAFLLSLLAATFPVFAQSPETILAMPVVIIDISGVIVGLISLVLILAATRTIGGFVGESLKIILIGIGFQVLAIIYTLIFVRFKLFGGVPGGIDVHHLLMIVGLVAFVSAAYHMAKGSKSK